MLIKYNNLEFATMNNRRYDNLSTSLWWSLTLWMRGDYLYPHFLFSIAPLTLIGQGGGWFRTEVILIPYELPENFVYLPKLTFQKIKKQKMGFSQCFGVISKVWADSTPRTQATSRSPAISGLNFHNPIPEKPSYVQT